ncbi:bifunctional DNA-formamidopyrimidine glycosylase/DNA-(apurinic or apyrimidinic site) lyase [Mobilicoccus pelagius]|uniref:Formamidopyrimidine-DNA glycosylase n=1 Tax=Mobilicoccus pelagius NBRC 104925 TaxID=1089455 RepID=H5UNE5_9MICO|nr:bifunctional DNA-formamidopyrimidine glycosylase/DNA-(apurinic or apyrimidinic site) lyase [Mobilicoccus pelagius]GAB47253.1 formamidopyrimidine-DNA glycosylase [Mobilicoccus pelagius NBRC 104925]
MPELPEVEVVRRGIADHVVGRTFSHVALHGSRVARRHVPGPDDLAARLAGRTVLAADRRGKYLWLALDGAEALVVHLGMSGQMLVEDPSAERRPHQHATFTFDDAGTQLRFVDQRTFGGLALVDLVPDPRGGGYVHGIPESVTHIAVDPLEDVFDARAVARLMRASRSGVKRLLLHQGVVSGIGNIYADESLWRARLHGERPAAAVTGPAIERLLAHVQDVMRAALEAGGTSFDALYVNVNGQSGYFDRSLDAYGQEGRPCARCGTPIRRETFMNRSSFSCPRCQPRPRVRRAAPTPTG